MQAYIRGVLAGSALGLMSAYLYARAAEEDADENDGVPSSIQTGTMISLALAILGLLRQIAEAGKPNKKKK